MVLRKLNYLQTVKIIFIIFYNMTIFSVPTPQETFIRPKQKMVSTRGKFAFRDIIIRRNQIRMTCIYVKKITFTSENKKQVFSLLHQFLIKIMVIWQGFQFMQKSPQNMNLKYTNWLLIFEDENIIGVSMF